MSIQDVIKKSFLQGFQNTNLTLKMAALLLVVAGLMGIYIFFVYRMVTVHSFYSQSFNVSLILMCLITAAIIITIQTSVVVSLGMVGALSIVRFRTALKEPMDLIFMFWSISTGIICGAGMPGLAVVLGVCVTLLALFFYHLPELRRSMILVINASDNDCASEIYSVIRKYDKNYHVKSRELTAENVDFLIEIRVRDTEGLLSALQQIKNVTAVSLVAHNGESLY